MMLLPLYYIHSPKYDCHILLFTILKTNNENSIMTTHKKHDRNNRIGIMTSKNNDNLDPAIFPKNGTSTKTIG